MGLSSRPNKTATVLAFIPPSLRGFAKTPTFATLIAGFEECVDRDAGVAQAEQLWLRFATVLVHEQSLEQFCAFLKRIRWLPANTPTRAAGTTLTEDQVEGLRQPLANLAPKPVTLSDPCYWFPAGRNVNAGLQQALGSANPIPIICKHLKVVFGESDLGAGARPKEVVRTPVIDSILNHLCVWVASGQDEETRSEVLASLLLCCDFSATHLGKSIQPGDVAALLIALRTPEPLREMAIEHWHRDLDFESDDRLMQGLDLVSRLSLTQQVPLDASLKKALKAAGVRFDSNKGPVIPVSVLQTMIAVLYCRWLGGRDEIPAYVEQLSRLFEELTTLGRVTKEGRAPFSSDDGYALAYNLHALKDCCPEMLGEFEPDDCEFVVLAGALGRHRRFEPDYFDVGEYVRIRDDASYEDIKDFFPQYKAFASAADRLGLRRLATAAWAFFLISVTDAFRGQLRTDWIDLEPELRRALAGPGGNLLAAAVGFAADCAKINAEHVNALRLRELIEGRSRPQKKVPPTRAC